MVVVLGVEAMYAFMHSKPKYIPRPCTEPEYLVLPAVYTIPNNNVGPTRELPPRTNSRYDIRPAMAVGPNGILDDVVYDMDDTGVYHPDAKKARALEKEMGVHEDKEAVKKKKQRMMHQQRAQKNKEKGGPSTGEDHNIAVEKEDSDNMLENKLSLHVILKLSSDPGKAILKIIGAEGNQWPVFKFSPPAEIALENIITAGGRKRKAALVRFGSESDDQGDYESDNEVDYESDDDHDEDWKAPGKRVGRHRLTKTGACEDCPSKDGQKLYCICQQPEHGFMILCEGPCNNWYHGSCVGITARMAEKMVEYICKDCAAAETQEDVVVGKSSTTTSYAHPAGQSGIQEETIIGQSSNIATCHAPSLVTSCSGPAQVGFLPDGIQEDATVGRSSVVSNYHGHSVDSYSVHVPIELHGAKTQQGAVVGPSNVYATNNVHPVQSYLGPVNGNIQTAGTQGAVLFGGAKFITTRLAQPVQFYFGLEPAHLYGVTPACHWCASPVYAVLGLLKMTYLVREMSNYLGYQEVDGGHRSLGHPASRMCSACTSKRVDILCCPDHTLELLPDNEYDANRGAALRLERNELTGAENESQWCSVCPEPARYKCNKSDGDNHDGCGLKLCQDCAEWFLMEHNGNLEELIEFLIAVSVKTKGEEWAGVRPDAVFLLHRGEMATRLKGGEF